MKAKVTKKSRTETCPKHAWYIPTMVDGKEMPVRVGVSGAMRDQSLYLIRGYVS